MVDKVTVKQQQILIEKKEKPQTTFTRRCHPVISK